MIRSTATFDATGGASSAFRGVTTNAIFAINVRRQPDAPALVDPPDRETVIDGPPRRLSYAEADRVVNALASKLRELGLPSGAVIGVQLPNTVESVLTVLAITRAGMAAALLPLLWRRREAARALAQVGAKAIVVGGRGDDAELAELALHVAADTFCVRFVCAFGDALPDGVIPLGDVFANAPHTDGYDSTKETEPHDVTLAAEVAVITFDANPNGIVPLPHTHAELLVGGLSIVLEAGLPSGARLVSPMLASSFAVYCSTVVPWILCGGLLELHQPFDAHVLALQLEQSPCDALVVPGLLAARMAESGLLGGSNTATRVFAIWRAPERRSASPMWTAEPALIDVLAFGEWGHLALRRDAEGAPRSMRLGPVTAPADTAEAPVVLNVGRTPGGTLALSGPMVPRAASDGLSPDEVDTGYACRVDPVTGEVMIAGAPAGLIMIGGYRFATGELQDMVGDIAGSARLAVLPDLLAGEKLAGLGADAVAMRRELAERGVSPLVADAFQDRDADGQAPAA